MGHIIGILVFDGAEELDFVGPWEVFTASAMLLDATFADHPRLDVVVVPGGQGTRRGAEDPALLGW